jgi:hypothetical protein
MVEGGVEQRFEAEIVDNEFDEADPRRRTHTTNDIKEQLTMSPELYRAVS